MPGRKSAKRQSYAESSASDDAVEGSRSAKKSKYFASAGDVSEAASSSGTSGYDDSSSRVTSDNASETDSSIISDESSIDRQAKSTSRRTSTRVAPKVQSKQKQAKSKKQPGQQRQSAKDVKDDTDEGCLEGDTVTFIPKLPALPSGDVEYSDLTIHPNTLSFLTALRGNNEREWFQQRELQYQAAKADFDTFIYALSRIIMTHDTTIPVLPAKDLTFRIYRDIRFSNDRTPYKTFLAAYFSRTGRKGPYAGYYIQVEPGDRTLLACGLWQPPPDDLLAVRQDIVDDPEPWNDVLDDPNFIQLFHGRQGLLKTKDKLKTCPKNFDKDHKEIELLRLKSFTVSLTFKDEEVLDPCFSDFLSAVIEQMEPLVTLLNRAIRPNDMG